MSLHAFPRQLTSFVGRERETSEVAAQLQQPACRLLTLAGPGGIGKTRLAIQVGTALQASFEDVYFVALQAVDAPDQLLYAIAEALGVALVDNDPLGQLIDHLQGAAHLLILDNFEQLLDAAALLTELLYATPQLKLLVTSREVINLQEEWVYPVEGLCLPDDPGIALDRNDAAQLFIERARRVDPHFDGTEQTDAILTICRLVGGTPLAIELAATWARSLTCEAIANEIRAGLHFLTSHQRNIPERHRSMRAVFDRSWNFLSLGEQVALRRLAVFQGDFQRNAAEVVAGATLPILTALVDKSLVRVATQGRYQLHELVRQYAGERLAEDEDETVATRRRHAEYYLSILAERRHDFSTDQQRTAIRTVNAEYENLRVAWYTAIDQLLFDALRAAGDPLQYFFDLQSRFVESTELLCAAYNATAHALTHTLPDVRSAKWTLARLGVPTGWALLRLGRLHEARDCLQMSRQLHDELALEIPPGFGTDPVNALAFITLIQGDFAAASALAEDAHRRLAHTGDIYNHQVLYYVLGNIAYTLGQYDEAKRHYQQGCKIVVELGNRWMQAYFVAELGKLALVRGDYDEAQQYYQACYALKEACEDEQGQAMSLAHLAELALRRGDTQAAHENYDRSATIYRRIHDRGGLITALQGQCDVALAEGDLAKAVRTLREALQVVQQTNLLPVVLSLLVTSAGLLCRLADDEPCSDLLALVLAHPACDQETRHYAQKMIDTLKLSSEAKPNHATHTAAPDWDALMQVINQIQTRLASPVHALPVEQRNGAATSPHHPHADHTGAPPNQSLVEPLTDRELEVLGLLADGLSNQAIADELIIAVGTVKSYTSHIYGKLAVANRTQAIVRAQELGII